MCDFYSLAANVHEALTQTAYCCLAAFADTIVVPLGCTQSMLESGYPRIPVMLKRCRRLFVSLTLVIMNMMLFIG